MSDKKGFGTMDLATVIGIQPTMVSKLIEREGKDGKYGVSASVDQGGRGRERIFSAADVYGIALIYWLSESGLRSDPIKYVLTQICGRTNSNDAAAVLIQRQPEVLAITRKPRTGYAKRPEQETRLCTVNDVAQLVKETSTRSILVIPVAQLLENLRARLAKKLLEFAGIAGFDSGKP